MGNPGAALFRRKSRKRGGENLGASAFRRREEIIDERRAIPLEEEFLRKQDIRAEKVAEQQQIREETTTPIGEDITRSAGQFAAKGVQALGGIINMGTEAIERLSRGGMFGDPSVVPGETEIGNLVREGTSAAVGAANRAAGPALTGVERFAGNLGEEAAASAVFGPIFRGAGTLLRRTTPLGERFLAKGSRQTLRDFTTDEALAVTGAAGGRTLAQEGGGGTGAEVFSGTVGAFATTLGAGALRITGRGARGIRGGMDRQAITDELREEVRAGNFSSLVNGDGSMTGLGRLTLDAVEAQGNRAQALELLDLAVEQGIAGDRFILSAAVDTPGFRTEQARALSRNPNVAAMVEARRDAGMKDLADRMFEMGGPMGLSSKDSGLFALEANLSRKLGEVNDKARALVPDGLDPLAHNQRLSEETNQILQELYDESVAAKDVLYQKIEDLAELNGAQWDPTEMIKARERTIDAQRRFLSGSNPPEDLMNEIAALDRDGVRWADLGSLEVRINEELANPKNTKSQNRLLGVLRTGITKTYREMEKDPKRITFFRGDPEVPTAGAAEILGETAQAGNEALIRAELVVKMGNARSFFTKHASMFRDGLSDKALNGNSSAASAAADALLGKYLHAGKGGARDAKAFILTFGKSKKAMQNGRDYLVGEAYRAALVPDAQGVKRLDRKRLGQWIQGHRRVLDLPEFSKARKTVTDLERLATEARELGIPGINDTITANNAALKKYIHQPDSVFNQIIKSQNPSEEMGRITSLLREHGDEAAMTSFRRRFWDNVIVQDGRSFRSAAGQNRSIPMVNASHIDEVLADPIRSKLLGELYSPEHITNLRKIADVQRGFDKIPARVNAPGDQLSTAFEDFAEAAKSGGIYSKILAKAQRVVRSTLAANKFVKSLNQTKVNAIIEEMIISEDLARLMLSAPTDANVERVRRFLGTNVPSLQFRAEESEQFEQEAEEERRQRFDPVLARRQNRR